jgi:broad specificity phosphatase PhoE
VLWRHGRTAWNGENRFQGHMDIPLDEVGRAQAARGAALLAGLGPHALASSDLQRARDTAAELARLTGLEIAVDRGLRETAGGRWEGLLATDIAATDAEAYAAWRSGSDVAAGGAETRSQVADRATAAVGRLLGSVADGQILVVATHGGTTRALMGRMLDLPTDRWGVLGGLANCHWSVLEEGGSGGWRLAEHNAGSLPEPVVGDDL